MADFLVIAFVDIGALEAVAAEANFTFAKSPTLAVGAEGVGVATSIIFLALVNVLALGAISDVSTETETAVAAKGVVAAGLRVTAVKAAQTFIDVTAQRAVTLVTHAARTGEVAFDL